MREDTLCYHMGYSFRLIARVLLYAPSHRQDCIYHSLCYTSRGALAGTRNSLMGPPHEGSIQCPIAPWANALTMELHLTPKIDNITSNINVLSMLLNRLRNIKENNKTHKIRLFLVIICPKCDMYFLNKSLTDTITNIIFLLF